MNAHTNGPWLTAVLSRYATTFSLSGPWRNGAACCAALADYLLRNLNSQILVLLIECGWECGVLTDMSIGKEQCRCAVS